MSQCPECWKAEASKTERLAAWVADWLARPSPAQLMMASYGRALRVMGGGDPEPTWFEKHRAAYEQTGDLAELDRMLRHVRP